MYAYACVCVYGDCVFNADNKPFVEKKTCFFIALNVGMKRAKYEIR